MSEELNDMCGRWVHNWMASDKVLSQGSTSGRWPWESKDGWTENQSNERIQSLHLSTVCTVLFAVAIKRRIQTCWEDGQTPGFKVWFLNHLKFYPSLGNLHLPIIVFLLMMIIAKFWLRLSSHCFASHSGCWDVSLNTVSIFMGE